MYVYITVPPPNCRGSLVKAYGKLVEHSLGMHRAAVWRRDCYYELKAAGRNMMYISAMVPKPPE